VDCYAAISSYDSGWENSAVAIRPLIFPWNCFRLPSSQRCSPLSSGTDRQSCLVHPRISNQTSSHLFSSIIILLLLSIQVDQSSCASIRKQYFSNTCIDGIISPLPIIVSFRFVSFHPISGRPAMVGSLMVPRQIVAFGGAMKSYQIISSYFVQCAAGRMIPFPAANPEVRTGKMLSGLRCISDSRHSRVASRVRSKSASVRLHSERERIRGPCCYRAV
jgi:hypothetical protein